MCRYLTYRFLEQSKMLPLMILESKLHTIILSVDSKDEKSGLNSHQVNVIYE